MEPRATRNQTIRSLRATGQYSLSSLARQFGLTRERIRQIAPENPHGRLRRGQGQARADAIYAWIVAYMTEHHGLPPTYADISAAFFLEKSTVKYYLHKLEAQGRIAFFPDLHLSAARNFYLPGATWTPPTR